MAKSPDNRQPNSSGARGRSGSALPADLRKLVSQCAKQIRSDHGELDKATADRLSRLLRSSITPRRKPGRKPTPEVLRAVELRDRSVPWPMVFAELIPGYFAMDLANRSYRSGRLRDAVGAHLRRRRQKACQKRQSEKPA